MEAHLLDFTDLLYGEEARVSFVARLRDDYERWANELGCPAGGVGAPVVAPCT